MELKLYLVKNRMTIKEFADMIEYSRPHLSGVISGKFNPSPRLIKMIQEATNGQVKVSDWPKKKKKEK